jgi:uridylate kinase
MSLPTPLQIRKHDVTTDGVTYTVSTLLAADLRTVTEVIVFAPDGSQYDFGTDATAAILAADMGADALAEYAEYVFRGWGNLPTVNGLIALS